MTTTPRTCPNCEADLRGEPIPAELTGSGFYAKGEHYSRVVGVEVRGVYDGVLYWQCPDCGHKWHRWPVGDYRRDRAAMYL